MTFDSKDVAFANFTPYKCKDVCSSRDVLVSLSWSLVRVSRVGAKLFADIPAFTHFDRAEFNPE